MPERAGDSRPTDRVKRPARRQTDREAARPRKDTSRLIARAPRESPARRVCLFSPSLGFGGVGHFTVTLAAALMLKECEVAVAAPAGALTGELGRLGVEHVELEPTLNWFRRREIEDRLEALDAEVFHAVTVNEASGAVKLARRLRKPLCVSVLDSGPGNLPRAKDGRFDAFLAHDATVRQRMVQECGLARDEVFLAPLAARVRPAVDDTPPDRARHKPCVAFIGPLVDGAGHREFIQAAFKAGARDTDLMFAIVGSGPADERIRAMIDEQGLQQRMVVVDRLFDFSLAWRPFDVVVIDARQEAAGVMVLEAMARGLPVVAPQGGSLFELIEDGVDGVLVRRDDAPALAERLLMLVQHPAERQRMARAAQQAVESHHTLEALARAVLAAYAATLSPDAQPAP